jgi:hypothetical protein
MALSCVVDGGSDRPCEGGRRGGAVELGVRFLGGRTTSCSGSEWVRFFIRPCLASSSTSPPPPIAPRPPLSLSPLRWLRLMGNGRPLFPRSASFSLTRVFLEKRDVQHCSRAGTQFSRNTTNTSTPTRSRHPAAVARPTSDVLVVLGLPNTRHWPMSTMPQRCAI